MPRGRFGHQLQPMLAAARTASGLTRVAPLHAAPPGPLLAENGLFPFDRDGAELRSRLEARFADLMDLLAERPGSWPLPPGQVAA